MSVQIFENKKAVMNFDEIFFCEEFCDHFS